MTKVANMAKAAKMATGVRVAIFGERRRSGGTVCRLVEGVS